MEVLLSLVGCGEMRGNGARCNGARRDVARYEEIRAALSTERVEPTHLESLVDADGRLRQGRRRVRAHVVGVHARGHAESVEKERMLLDVLGKQQPVRAWCVVLLSRQAVRTWCVVLLSRQAVRVWCVVLLIKQAVRSWCEEG